MDEEDYDLPEEDNDAPELDVETSYKKKQATLSNHPDGFWDSDRVRRVLSRQVGRCLGAPVRMLQWRHLYVAISREQCRTKDTIAALYGLYGDVQPNDVSQSSDASQPPASCDA